MPQAIYALLSSPLPNKSAAAKRALSSFGTKVAFASCAMAPTTAKKFTSDKHLAQGLECSACHGEGPKKPVTGAKCLECHESFDNVAKRTQDMDPNPHDNHQSMQGISCIECHKGHHPDVVFCQQCHGDMKLTRNSKK